MRLFNLGLRPKQLARLMLLGFVVGCFGGTAEANPSWKSMQGHSECGGLTKEGKLQEACGFTRATKIGKALGKCPSGSFFDIGTWACFSCPTGFNRNARAVTSPKACDKAVTPKTSPAKFGGKVNCPAGSILDGRNGGECWACPSGFGRTANAVDKWNACGMIGKKAVSALFKGKACPTEGSFRDPRNGGECWSCPEDYSRTGNAVTSDKACKTVLDFEPATKAAALTCEPGEHFDFVDGGTCWACAVGEKRTLNSVKGAKACRNNSMKWVVPTRGMYGLFGLGRGADDILAKLIADRTEIDKVVKIAAEAGETDEAEALKLAWDVIDKRPWESAYLTVLMQGAIMRAAAKPVAERTDSEKDVLAIVAKLIQWNRQFIAYQAKQAHETWVTASKMQFAEATAKMGAAAIYADSMVTPPDYNELLVSSIQASAGIAGPVGSLLVTLFVKPVSNVMLPFRKAARKAAIEAAKQAAKTVAGSGGATTGTVAAAAAGPLMTAAAAAVIVTMEMDKFAKLQEEEGKIRQSIAIADSPVDMTIFFQQKNGEEEFKFHWATVIGAATPPSAYFKARLAAYKNGTADKQIAFPTINMNSTTVAADKPDVVTADTVKIETIQTTSVVVGANSNTNSNSTRPFEQTASKLMLAAIKRQTAQPTGAMRFELTNAPGFCLSKGPGTTTAMVLANCNATDTLWFKFDKDKGNVVFADKYCLRLASEAPKSDTAVYLNDCGDASVYGFELTKSGLIKSANANNCVGVDRRQAKGSAVVSLNCSSFSPRQIWRPWAVN